MVRQHAGERQRDPVHDSAQPLAFGNYDPVQANATAPLDAQTTLRWRAQGHLGDRHGHRHDGTGRRAA